MVPTDTLRECKSCWNCKHSVFKKRTSHQRGVCVQSVTELNGIPDGWRPPPEFWNAARDGSFKENWDEFVPTGVIYFGDKFVLELASKKPGRYLDMGKAKKDHAIMASIYRGFHKCVNVRSMQVCDLHEDNISLEPTA